MGLVESDLFLGLRPPMPVAASQSVSLSRRDVSPARVPVTGRCKVLRPSCAVVDRQVVCHRGRGMTMASQSANIAKSLHRTPIRESTRCRRLWLRCCSVTHSRSLSLISSPIQMNGRPAAHSTNVRVFQCNPNHSSTRSSDLSGHSTTANVGKPSTEPRESLASCPQVVAHTSSQDKLDNSGPRSGSSHAMSGFGPSCRSWPRGELSRALVSVSPKGMSGPSTSRKSSGRCSVSITFEG